MGALLDRSFPWHEEDPVVVQLYLYAHFKDQNDAQYKIDQSFFKQHFKARRSFVFDQHYDYDYCNDYSLAVPVPYNARAVRWWLKLEGFTDGDYRKEAIMQEFRRLGDDDRDISTLARITPMGRACHRGELKVAEWLHYEQDVDIQAPAAKSAKVCTDMTPLHFACLGGHLVVCQWLVARGADATTLSAQGLNPMRVACVSLRLNVCEWLEEQPGVAPTFADLTQTLDRYSDFGYNLTTEEDQDGSRRAAVCQWLLLAGVAETTKQKRLLLEDHPATESLVVEALKSHDLFYHAFLPGTVMVPAAQRRVYPPSKWCRLPMLPTSILERISLFLNVPRGRRLRRARRLSAFAIKYQAFGRLLQFSRRFFAPIALCTH